jgi:peptidoglycan hydrolase-like protein with peptidoglycan-binding domain
MKHATTAVALLLAAAATAGQPAFAQYPGETKGPRSYDPVGDMQHNYQRWAPNEKVREAQQSLRDKGFYKGELDGVMNPAFRRAVWDFQRAKGLPRTARLDETTMAAIDLPATGVASPPTAPGAASPPTAPGAPSSFGTEPGSVNRSEFPTPRFDFQGP